MRTALLLIIFAFLFSACSHKTETFEYTISGKIIGEDSGQIELLDNSGEDIFIQFKDSKFEHTGTATRMHLSTLSFSDDKEGLLYPIVIEPGDILVELYKDSTIWKSKTISGENSIAVYQAYNTFLGYQSVGVDLEALPDSVLQLIHKNRNNYAGIFLLNTMGRFWPLYEQDELGEFLEEIRDPMFLNSRDYRELYSYWLSQKDSINETGQKATDFSLPDISGKLNSFKDISEGKYTFIELSSTTCSNSTQSTRDLLPVYNSFRSKGFEIITIVSESDHDRWVQWIEKEKFPWITLVESDTESEDEVLYSDLLFNNGNYLIDKDGVVIANNLNVDSLNKLLEDILE